MSTDLSPAARPGLVPFARHSWAGLRVLLVLTVLLGFGYPALVTAIGQVAFRWQANGSLLAADGEHAMNRDDGQVIGSALVGQAFTGPEWFHPRPSAAGQGYDTLASGGSNLGPLSPDLLSLVEERRDAVGRAEGVDPDQVPVDALTASASGLDPDISPQYAALQVDRVATARSLASSDVADAVEACTQERALRVLGEPRVNVLCVNLAVSTMST